MSRTRATGGLLALAVAAGCLATPAFAQHAADDTAVLVFSRTAGFRHASIPDAVRTVRALGGQHGFTVEATEDPAVFTDEELERFDAVVFANTTGDVLDDVGQAAFERFVRGGGGWVGIHSAADTEYEWPFYGELLGGAWFLAHPVQQPGVVVREDAAHPSTAHLEPRWFVLLEEWYSFVRSPRDRVHVLLSIDESTYLQNPNTTNLPGSPDFPLGRSGVMGDHPISWCVDVGDGRAWYTAMGHESHLYQLPEYRQHLLQGLLTAAGVVDADCTVGAAAPAPTEAPPTEAPPTEAPPTAAPTAAPAPTSVSVPSSGAATDDLPATGAAALLGPGAGLALGAAWILRRRRR